MSMTESACNGRYRNIDKWVALGMMKKAEEVKSIAEMLEASMEDLFDQMGNLNSNLDLLSDATEALQEKMEEMVDMMNGEMYPDSLSPLISSSDSNPLPF